MIVPAAAESVLVASAISFGAGGIGGMAVDYGVQCYTQRDEEEITIDHDRALKAGFETGLGAAIPGFGISNPTATFGTGLVASEGTFLIGAGDSIYTYCHEN